MKEDENCTECGDILHPDNIVWLELSNTDGFYYNKLPEGHMSQGWFPFGKTCSKKIKKD